MHGGNYYLCGDCVEMIFKDNIIVILIRRELENIPIVYNSFVYAKDKKEVKPHIQSAMAYSNLTMLNFFRDLQTSNDMISVKNLAPWVATTAAFRNTLLLALGHRALRYLPRCTVRGSGEREGL